MVFTLELTLHCSSGVSSCLHTNTAIKFLQSKSAGLSDEVVDGYKYQFISLSEEKFVMKQSSVFMIMTVRKSRYCTGTNGSPVRA